MSDVPPLSPLYLEDLAPGRRFASAVRTLDEAQIVAFARQFDPQPFHTGAAAAGPFGGLVASGWHTAAFSMRLIVESLPIAGGIIGVGGEAEWPLPVRPGDSLHVEGEILAVRPSRSRPDRGIVTARVETINQKNEVVQILTAKLMAFRRLRE